MTIPNWHVRVHIAIYYVIVLHRNAVQPGNVPVRAANVLPVQQFPNLLFDTNSGLLIMPTAQTSISKFQEISENILRTSALFSMSEESEKWERFRFYHKYLFILQARNQLPFDLQICASQWQGHHALLPALRPLLW